jgi:hypothetical protein
LFREFAIAKERRLDERNAEMSQAWHSAAFQRAEKMPRLDSVLTKPVPKRQTMSEQRAMLEALSKTIGIPLRTRTKAVA